MTVPVTILILVAAGERSDLTRAMTGATHDALGPNAIVAVRDVTGTPSDSEALAVEQHENVDAVVELTWVDVRHQQASVRMHVVHDRRWVERSIGFLPSDADSERGRTLGFAIASILPENPVVGEAARAGSTTSPVGPDGTEPHGEPPPPPRPESRPLSSAAPAMSVPQPVAAPTLGRAKESRIAVDALAIGSLGLNGSANSLGGSAALQWFAFRRLSLRIGAGLRGGDIDAAQATTLTMTVCAGPVFHLWRTNEPGSFGVSARVEYALVLESLTHFALGTATKSRFLSGVDFVADGSWRVGSDVDIVAGAGLEDVFGTTYVVVAGKQVDSLPTLSPVAEVGLRLEF
jgi:hypothetical protein